MNTTGKTVSPMAFVPGAVDKDKKRKERVKSNIRSLFMMSRPRNAEETRIVKDRIMSRLKKAGHQDAEELFNETFPSSNRGTK